VYRIWYLLIFLYKFPVCFSVLQSWAESQRYPQTPLNKHLFT
jgi:hypothetical protein